MATHTSEPRLRLAVEITSDRVIAARAAATGGALEAVSSRSLTDGVVRPNLIGTNVHDRGELVSAIRDALSTVGARGRDTIVVLPDAASRISLLDFDTLPERRQEAEGVLRFRLKKSLPFDIDKAAISYEAVRANGSVKVVAATALQSIVQEYEEAVREAGFSPGVVVPSMAAALGAVDATHPTLVIKADPGTAGLAIVHRNELMLLRTLEMASISDPDQLADDVFPALVFFEDTYHTRVERLLVGGVLGAALVPALERATGLAPQELVSATMVSGDAAERAAMGGIVGALIG